MGELYLDELVKLFSIKDDNEFKEEIFKQGTGVGNTLTKFARSSAMFLLILFFIICNVV